MTSQILMKLLPAILGCPLPFLPSPWLTASFFGKQEVLRIVHIWAYIIYVSFILCLICSSRVFKCLSNFKFLLRADVFLAITHQIRSNSFDILTVMQCKVMNHICNCFGVVLKIPKSWICGWITPYQLRPKFYFKRKVS